MARHHIQRCCPANGVHLILWSRLRDTWHDLVDANDTMNGVGTSLTFVGALL